MSAVRAVLWSLAASAVLAAGAAADSTAAGAADRTDWHSWAVRDASPAEHPLTGTALEYIWPVHGTVIDPFRMPEHPYGPGNRGLEFATQPGSAFWAAAHGVVSFAGQVGGRLHVTVTHPDGLRVSYSGVADIAVAKAQRVRQGEALGTTADRLHVGVRRGTAYIDPASIFGGSLAESPEAGRPGAAPSLRLGRPRLVRATVSVYRLQLRWLHSAAGNALLRAGS